MTAATIKTAGYPAPAISASGLPNGVSLTDNGNGTATVSGTPDAGTGGVYPVTITATSTSGTATANVTYTVNQAPAFTSVPTSLTIQRGVAMTPVTVTASGYPAPTFTITGQPVGVMISSAGVLSGTPKATDTLKTFTVTVTAKGVGSLPSATQTFTITLTS